MPARDDRPDGDDATGTPSTGDAAGQGVAFEVERFRLDPPTDEVPPPGGEGTSPPEAAGRFAQAMTSAPAHDAVLAARAVQASTADAGETVPPGRSAAAEVPPDVQAAAQRIQAWLAATTQEAREQSQTTFVPEASGSPGTASTEDAQPSSQSQSRLKAALKVTFGLGAVLAVTALGVVFFTVAYAWMHGWDPVTVHANMLSEGRLEAILLGVGLFASGGMLFHYLSLLKRW